MTTPNFGELPPLQQQQLVFLFFLEAAFIWDSLLPKRERGKDGIVARVQCMTLGNEPRMSLQWIKRAIERANVEREGKRDGEEGLMSSSIKVSGMEVWQSLLECPSRDEPAGLTTQTQI